jgi:hypothetical protein
LNRVQVVPLTSNVERLFPGEAFVTLRGERRKAMADQLTTASPNAVHFTILMAAAKSIRTVGCGVRGRSL